MSESLILEKLDGLSDRLGKIEQVMSLIAVQDEKILNLQTQVSQLWVKHDVACGPKGVISQITSFQASCPRDNFKTTMANQAAMLRAQWAVITLLVVVTVGTLFKALGVV